MLELSKFSKLSKLFQVIRTNLNVSTIVECHLRSNMRFTQNCILVGTGKYKQQKLIISRINYMKVVESSCNFIILLNC